MKPNRRYSPEGIVAVILFLVLIGVVSIQVLGRTPLMRGLVWTEEAARWIWVWMAFIGIGEVERQNKHLRMAFLAEKLTPSIRSVMFTIIDFLYLGIVGHLCWIGFQTVQRTWSNSSVTLPMTNAVLYASAFAAFLLVLHRILQRLLSGRSGTISGGSMP